MHRVSYVCEGVLKRDATPLLASVTWVEAVLASGRSIVIRPDLRDTVFVLVDVDGTQLTTLSFRDWSGSFMPLRSNSSVQGERAWVMALRTRPDGSREFFVVRVDGDTGAWDLVRRLPLPVGLGQARIALPDGHVLMELADTETIWDLKFVDFPPGGPPRVLWREADALEVRLHERHQFMAGPIE